MKLFLALLVATGALATVCETSEYCCPDAKKCLTPTKKSCLKDATVCSEDEVCCPLTKLCVKPGKDCQSPCEDQGTYCCPDALSCLKPTNPGVLCSAATDCNDGEVCCPITNLCVKPGDKCAPPVLVDLKNKVKKNLGSNGFTCSMCKKLLPYIGNHECSSECSKMWSWTQSSCDYLCDKLVQYAPSVACVAAGYCPAEL